MNTKERILNLIKNNFESDAEFERKLNLKPKTVDSWRRDNSKAYLKILPDLSTCFNVSTDYLLGNTNDPNPPNKKTPDENPSDELKYEDLIISFYHGKDTKVSEKSKEKILDYVRLVLEDEKREKKSDN